MAPPLPAKTDESMRRARNRERVLLMLSSLGESNVTRLGRTCGIPPSRVKWIMHGHPPHYSVELSLAELGLATRVETKTGRVYAITDLGRRKARSITASRIRARERRAARDGGSAVM